MKGITPVVAIILLLLVTISMVGFAMGFFQRLFGQAGTGVENQTQNILQRTSMTISIDNLDAANRKVTVRSTGTAEMAPKNDISVFVAGTSAACAWTTDPIPARATSTCEWSSPAVTECAAGSGKTVKVVAPGNEDSRAC